MGWPLTAAQSTAGTSGSMENFAETASSTRTSTYSHLSAELFASNRVDRVASCLSPRLGRKSSSSSLDPAAILEIAITKATNFYNATQAEFRSSRDALIKFLGANLEKVKELACKHEKLSSLLAFYNKYIGYEELFTLLKNLPKNSRGYRTIHSCCFLFYGSASYECTQTEKAILEQCDIADQTLKEFRNHSDSAILHVSRLISALQQSYPEVSNLHCLEGFLRQNFQQISSNVYPENCVRFSEEIHRLLPQQEINIEIQELATSVDVALGECSQAIIARNKAFLAAQEIMKKNLCATVYIARKIPRVTTFLNHSKMHVFWENVLTTRIRRDYETTSDFTFLTQPGLNPLNLLEAIECDVIANNLENLDEHIQSRPIIQDLIKKARTTSHQVELFIPLQDRHSIVCNELLELNTEQSEQWLIRAILLATQDPKLTDTSCIFEKTCEAQKLFRSPAILQEAMNKMVVGISLNNFSSRHEDKTNQENAQIFAQLYFSRGLYNMYLAKILEDHSEINTNNALFGKPAIKSIVLRSSKNAHFTSWCQIENWMLAKLNLTADCPEVNTLRLEAQQTAVEQYGLTDQQAWAGLQTFNIKAPIHLSRCASRATP